MTEKQNNEKDILKTKDVTCCSSKKEKLNLESNNNDKCNKQITKYLNHLKKKKIYNYIETMDI